MTRHRSERNPRRLDKGSARRLGNRLHLLLGAAVTALLVIVALTVGAPLAAQSPAGQGQGKHFKATRAIVVDKQTGTLRMPTQQEVDEMVATLSTLGQRPDETLQQSASASGAVSVDLAGGFAGILLGRPNGDGTWETKCVFTLEEGAEFLGLVEDVAVKG